jgi:hypothetical protein
MVMENKREILLSTLLTVMVNLALAFTGIFIYAKYYTPGNPIVPDRTDIDIIGLLGTFFGASQILYLAPLAVVAFRLRKWNLLKGIILGSVVTVLLNVLMIASMLKKI